MVGIALAASKMVKYKNNKVITNRDKYEILKHYNDNPEIFWNSLNHGKYYMFNKHRHYFSKIDIGGLAIHHGFMTPRTCRFDVTNTQFEKLSKWQQKVIKAVLKTTDEAYTPIGLRALCGDLFRIK